MENSIIGNLAKSGQTIADKIGDLRSDAAPALKKAVSRAQSMSRQGADAIGDVVSQARDAASNASDSLVAYTRKNPVTALAIAVASGALLYAAVKAITSLRD
jgi:ElaB/YqjD/DUF883 family membrane-anchored ribosome-binding protein